MIEFCHAKATTSCDAATASGDDIECTTFTAKLRDPVKPASAGGCMVTATDKTITVQNDDTKSGIAVGADLIIARHSDGFWFVIKLIC